MKPIISVRNLSKRYDITRPRHTRLTLRERCVNALKTPFQYLSGNTNQEHEVLWALRDVSFDVRPGEAIGIIGSNGAGKSTLLKILSRITKPSAGEVDLYGRVGNLLGVGIGFHPNLTGRENIYLHATILGMKRSEIKRKFDEIVAFAELEQFLETPVKHYSSGMYVRLGFAIAAHFEPEILLLDEVIAVGDAAFQKKSVEKIRESTRKGQTVFFVSHDLKTIRNLCSRVLFMRSGQLYQEGDASSMIAAYTASHAQA